MLIGNKNQIQVGISLEEQRWTSNVWWTDETKTNLYQSEGKGENIQPHLWSTVEVVSRPLLEQSSVKYLNNWMDYSGIYYRYLWAG